MVWDRKTNFFRKKMVFGRKTNFFLGKTKKNQKKNFLRHYAARHQNLLPRKKLVFLSKTIFFPRKELVFLSKTIFFLGKTKKNIFLVSGRIVSQKMFFFWFSLGKRWFSFQNLQTLSPR